MTINEYQTAALRTAQTDKLSASDLLLNSAQDKYYKYYLKVDNRIVAEYIPLEYALIFIKSIFENYYNDHEIVISIAEMERCEDCEVSK